MVVQRRFFTVFALLAGLAVLISACQPAPTTEAPLPTQLPTNTLVPSATGLLEPTITVSPTNTAFPTDLPSLTPSDTPIPTLSPQPCLKLIFPEDGSQLPQVGLISFLWDEQPGAVAYRLEIFPPGGKVVVFITPDTLRNQYAESLPWGGEHKWQVEALDASGKTICTSQTFTFTKPKPPVISTWTMTPNAGELQATVPSKTPTPPTLTPQPSQ